MIPIIKEPGNIKENKTGKWTNLKAQVDFSKCTQCMLCWSSCPDNAIPERDGKRLQTDFNYCKACGICAKICPVKAITMIKKE